MTSTTRSPRQNRVNPFGELVAVPDRGHLFGNRGNLHDEHGNIRRHHQVKRWIYCRLEFKGRRRQIMRPGHYTELFFWDEPTALAAGHRPCAECMRARYNEFRDALGERLPATELDELLHRARITADGRRVTFGAPLGDLPAGVIVLTPDTGKPYLFWDERLWRWTSSGYGPGAEAEPTLRVVVLTPKPTTEAIAAGFIPRPMAKPASPSAPGRPAAPRP
jgi:hypothetical protein